MAAAGNVRYWLDTHSRLTPAMRRLIVIPIIHTSADLGSLADSVRTQYQQKYGADIWGHRERAVAAFWEELLRPHRGFAPGLRPGADLSGRPAGVRH